MFGTFAADIHSEFSGPTHPIANGGRHAENQGDLHGKSRTSCLRLSLLTLPLTV